MRKKTIQIAVLLVLIFIWGHSCVPRSISAAESDAVQGWIQPFLEFFVGKGNVTDYLVRKLAHFTEYGGLGFLLALLLRCCSLTNRWRIAYGCVGAIMVALVDETIQIFSGRGPMIQDVWLDFFGAVCGGMVGWLLMIIYDDKRSA